MDRERVTKITESEWQIMEQVWAYQESMDSRNQADGYGITQPALMKLLGRKWNKNTVHTFLKRLCEKGFLEVVKDSSPHRYAPLVSREVSEKEERRSFLDRVYQGSAGRMVAAFVRDGDLSEEDVRELRKLLEGFK